MISSSAASFLIDLITASKPQNRALGEEFPAMEEARLAKQEARSAARRNRFRTGWKAIAGAPHSVRNQAARLVPASIKAALNARAEARILAISISRLEELSPHLLADVGIEQMARGVYTFLETDENLAKVSTPEPAVASFQPEPAAPTINPPPHRVRRPSASRAPAALAGAVSI